MILWWHWVALGIVLVVAELFVPAFFILWFGLGALLTGVLLLVWPSLPLAGQLAFFGVFSLVCVVGWFRVFRSRFRSESAVTEESAAVGERGLTTFGAGEPGEIGRVRFVVPVLGADIWDFVADEPISVGTPVRVVAVLVSERGPNGGSRRILKVEKVR